MRFILYHENLLSLIYKRQIFQALFYDFRYTTHQNRNTVLLVLTSYVNGSGYFTFHDIMCYYLFQFVSGILCFSNRSRK